MNVAISIFCLIILYVIWGLIRIPSINYKTFFLNFRKNKSPKLYNNEFNFPIEKVNDPAMYTENIKELFEYIQKLSYKNFDLKYLPHVMGHSRINLYLNSYSAPDEVFENKFYWFLFCKKYKFNHPKTYIVKQLNKVYKFNTFDNEETYLIKPLTGCQGYGIEKIKGSQINQIINQKNNFLIQDVLKDNFTNCISRHFRPVTTFDGDICFLKSYCSENNFRSNLALGAKYNDILDEFNNNKTKLSIIEINLLKDIIKKLKNVHKRFYNYIFSIGWDVMFSDNKIYILEGNVYGHGASAKNELHVYKYLKKAEIFYNNLFK